MELGALPENELVWRTKTGQLSMPGKAGATGFPAPALQPSMTPQARSYPDLPLSGAFPFEIRQPFITRNLVWYTGAPILNIGVPQARNDWREYLRSAMVDSDWESVEKFVGWYLANVAVTAAQRSAFYRGFNFGSYKWVMLGNGQRKFYPFSAVDYETFFERLKRFETGKDASPQCIENSLKLHLVNLEAKHAQVARGVPMILNIGYCPELVSLTEGLIRVAAVAAVVIGGGYALSTIGPAAGAATPGLTASFATPGISSGGLVTGGFTGTVGTGATKTLSATVLSTLKKFAIEKGIDYAMGEAAKWYAEKQQEKMTAQMEKDMQAQLVAAQKEYAALIASGVAPEKAASQASGESGKFGALIPLAGILAMLLLRSG